jgi:hypothetical protein
MYSVRKGDDEERRSVRIGAGQRQPAPVMMRAARITLWHGREERKRERKRKGGRSRRQFKFRLSHANRIDVTESPSALP